MLIDNAKVVAQYLGDEGDDYEDCCCEIDTLMGDNEWWHVHLVGFGWRKLSGSKVFKVRTGRELLSSVLPHANNSFKVYAGDKPMEFAINNVHHDSPIWGVEWYTIRKATEDEIAANT